MEIINSYIPTNYNIILTSQYVPEVTIFYPENLFEQYAFISVVMRREIIRMESLIQRPHCWLILLDHEATWHSTPVTADSFKTQGQTVRSYKRHQSSFSRQEHLHISTLQNMYV